ncbi:unnamed protein product, partial [Iphiclides podalirius]
MLSGDTAWRAVAIFCEKVMVQKEAAERERERMDPTRRRGRRHARASLHGPLNNNGSPLPATAAQSHIVAAKLIKLASGSSMLMYDRYTFSRPTKVVRAAAGTLCWRCTGRGANRCHVYIHVDSDLLVVKTFNEPHSHPPPNYAQTSSGYLIKLTTGRTLLMYDNYTFSTPTNVARTFTKTQAWRCTGRGSFHCKMYIHVDTELRVLKTFNEHSHPPAKYAKISGGLEYKFIPSSKGKNSLILIENYTFNRVTTDNRYWTCSRRISTKCKARLRFDHQKNIVLFNREHNHSPPRYVCHDGGQCSDSIGFTDLEVLEEHVDESEPLLFVETKRGTTILHYGGHQYKRGGMSMSGMRWKCAVNKQCGAYLCLDDSNEIVDTNPYHDHDDNQKLETIEPEESDTAVVITSRKGKEMLLFRKYTYRKQYQKSKCCRWVCSTMKNCRGCVFTDHNNFITSAFEEHCHDPPKYYLNPHHVLDALRAPIVLETE